MGETVVTIKLSGEDYRTLCRELEYHVVELKNAYKAIGGGPDKQNAMNRMARFERVAERVKS